VGPEDLLPRAQRPDQDRHQGLHLYGEGLLVSRTTTLPPPNVEDDTRLFYETAYAVATAT
jgi:hypothetical protein